MKKFSGVILTSLILVFELFTLMVVPARAQTPEAPVYTLGISRDFGYGAGAQIRGTFSVKIAGPEGIRQVEFFIDGQTMAIVSASPFKYQFNTSSYPSGEHELTAKVTTTDGKVYETPARHFDFVTQAQESEGMQKILIPMLGLIGGIMLVTVLAQTLLFRGRKNQEIPLGTERHYGMAGGSICPKCKRPTPRHLMGFNLGIGKLDYCENCGKWSIMRAVPLEILRAAEIAEKADAAEGQKSPLREKSEEEKLKELLEESKYDNKN